MQCEGESMPGGPASRERSRLGGDFLRSLTLPARLRIVGTVIRTHPDPRREEDQRQARHHHQEGRDDGVKDAAGRQGHADEVVGERAVEAPANRADGFAAELDGPGDHAEVAVVQRRVRCAEREVGSTRECNAHMRGGERRGVVDAVSDEERLSGMRPRRACRPAASHPGPRVSQAQRRARRCHP